MLLGVSGLYGMNRFLLLPWLAALDGEAHHAKVLYHLLGSYGADVLAGAWIMCFLNLLLVWSGRNPIRSFAAALLFVFGCGIFWEYITPLYLSRSVGDPVDFAAYLIGVSVYMVFEKRMCISA